MLGFLKSQNELHKYMTKKPSNRAKGSKTKRTRLKGSDLLEQVIHLTGIPAQAIQRELKTILEKKNLDIDQLTVDQLRLVVASYLRQIMHGVMDKCGSRKSDEHH